MEYLWSIHFFSSFHILSQNLQMIVAKKKKQSLNFDVAPISSVMDHHSFGFILSNLELAKGSRDYELQELCIASLKEMVYPIMELIF